MNYNLKFTKQARKDLDLIKNSHLKNKVRTLLEIIEKNPYQNPPPYEKLNNNLKGFISRRINNQHRLVYMVDDRDIIIKALWTHYES